MKKSQKFFFKFLSSSSYFFRPLLVSNRVKGFTLIELLVVVAIIGLLASVVLASLSTARQQARDATRVADMNQIKTALELYYSEHGHYPCNNPDNATDSGTHLNIGNSGRAKGEKMGVGNNIDQILAPYMNGEVPNDPIGDGAGDVYYYYYDGYHLNSENDWRAAVIAFNKAETKPRSEYRQDTTSGGDGNIDEGYFNIVLGKSCTEL